MYRVTHLLVQNLPLTSKVKFRFGLACPGLARPKRNFTFEVNGRFCTRRWVDLYSVRHQVVSFLSTGSKFMIVKKCSHQMHSFCMTMWS